MSGKQRAKPKRKADSTLAQFGIFDVPDLNSMDQDDDDDDDADDGDLEAELHALLSGKAPQRKPRQPKKAAPSVLDVEKMAAECMKEPGSDDDDDDGNLSGEEDLLAELKNLVPEASETSPPKVVIPSRPVEEPPPPPKSAKSSPTSVVDVLSERIALYKEAESVSKSCGDTSKARRYGRAVKTLEGLMKSARAGQAINEEDIPPPVAIPKPKPKPSPVAPETENDVPHASQAEEPPPLPPPRRPAPTPPSSTKSPVPNGDLSIGAQLAKRRDQYKIAACKAKKLGDTKTAIKYVGIAKKFDAVIEAESSGQPVDLSNMPPPPPEFSNDASSVIMNDKVPQNRIESEKSQMSSQPSEMETAALAAASGPEDPTVFNAPPPPSSISEALQQRLEKFSSTRDTAQAEGNSSKARRLDRIVKQYQAAIKNYKAGKPVDFDELPVPPGFAPIPVGDKTPAAAAAQPQVPAPKAKAPVPPKNSQGAGAVAPGGPTAANKPAVPGQKGSTPPGANKGKLQRSNTSSVLEKQLNFLLERQKLFRQAALESKKNGDMQQAKEYLRMSKGFDSMIEATRCGLPIDATSIPTPPQLEADYVIIEKSDCIDETGEENSEQLFKTIEKDLEQQIEICTRNKEHFLRLGDVSSASKFEKLGLNSKKDLAVVRHKWENNDALPRFHYETRLFSMVQCHTDLGDNDIEVAVERGINLPGKPDDLDSYIRIELPLPPESPLRAKTHTVKDTNNPIFQETFKFEFNRKSRSILRHFKRQALKLEVWSKGGFLRSDTLLGVAAVKLVDLESKCTIHDSFDLMEGRKTCGGKVEVKVRIRDPLLAKQVEEVREKWLVIGS